MNTEDDNNWFDTLTGKRKSVGNDSSVNKEANVLRRAILTNEKIHSRASSQVSESDKKMTQEKLMFRLKSEGLLEETVQKNLKPKWQQPKWFAAVAAVLVVALAIPILMDRQNSGNQNVADIRYYGGLKDIVIKVSNVEKTKTHLVAKFTEMGILKNTEELNSAWYLTLKIKMPPSKKMVSHLIELGVIKNSKKSIHQSGTIILLIENK